MIVHVFCYRPAARHVPALQFEEAEMAGSKCQAIFAWRAKTVQSRGPAPWAGQGWQVRLRPWEHPLPAGRWLEHTRRPRGRENGRRMELSLRERIKKQEHSFKKKGKGDERRKWENIYLKGLACENVN